MFSIPNPMEQKLFKVVASYSESITQTSGVLVITKNSISYKPKSEYALAKSISLNMSDIANAEKGSMMGASINIRTKNGKYYCFKVDTNSGASESQKAVELINAHKS